jgi:hypothetical protein
MALLLNLQQLILVAIPVITPTKPHLSPAKHLLMTNVVLLEDVTKHLSVAVVMISPPKNLPMIPVVKLPLMVVVKMVKLLLKKKDQTAHVMEKIVVLPLNGVVAVME